MDLDRFKRLKVEVFPDRGADLDGEIKLELRASPSASRMVARSDNCDGYGPVQGDGGRT